jgi:hypothetical protein
MDMKLSVFTTMSDPQGRGDNWKDAINCYIDLADEVVVVDGDTTIKKQESHGSMVIVNHRWPQEFDWPFIGQQFQRGYEAATGDWVIHADLDFLFHQRDFGKIRQALRDYPDAPAVSFYKWQFILPDRYNLKSRLVIAVNKGKFGDRIKFDSGGDLCQPSLDGKELKPEDVPQAGVPFYNYEKLTKTAEQIKDDAERMERAYQRHFKIDLYSYEGNDAYTGLINMMCGRYNKPQKEIPLSDHPKYVQETIKNLKPEQWGYNGLGLLPYNNYAKGA